MITTAYIKAGGGAPTGWQRPNDWIAIPAIAGGEQVFYGLVAVYDVVDGNRVAFTFAGNYTVDWGDGSALENVLSGVKASHLYDFANVANPTSEGWRQALIKVIPTGAANITSVNLQAQVTGIANGKTSQFMDIVMSVPNVTGAGTNLIIANGVVVAHRVVERIDIRDIGAINSMLSMFNGCVSLQSVPLFNTGSVTNMTTMFVGCNSLQSVPLFNTGSVTNMTTMFQNCVSLQSVPLFNTGSVTNMTTMFQNCNSLQSVPLFNTASVTNMDRMFSGCSSLQTVPLFNTISNNNAIGMQGMFTDCRSLQSVALFDTTNVKGMGLMFSGCSSLQSVPAFNTPNVTSMQQMFSGCSSLQTVPLFNMSSVIAMGSMFFDCRSLQQVPVFTPSVLLASLTMFQGCVSLYELEMNMASFTSTANMMLSTGSLQRFIATGLTRGISVSGNLMSATELDNFFTSLGTAVGAQTIIVTGNPGAATCDTSIATTKGFTVTI